MEVDPSDGVEGALTVRRLGAQITLCADGLVRRIRVEVEAASERVNDGQPFVIGLDLALREHGPAVAVAAPAQSPHDQAWWRRAAPLSPTAAMSAPVEVFSTAPLGLAQPPLPTPLPVPAEFIVVAPTPEAIQARPTSTTSRDFRAGMISVTAPASYAGGDMVANRAEVLAGLRALGDPFLRTADDLERAGLPITMLLYVQQRLNQPEHGDSSSGWDWRASAICCTSLLTTDGDSRFKSGALAKIRSLSRISRG